jgi:hypothetical protein
MIVGGGSRTSTSTSTSYDLVTAYYVNTLLVVVASNTSKVLVRYDNIYYLAI